MRSLRWVFDVFPIPMRGNETAKLAKIEAKATFPIPMRGNERFSGGSKLGDSRKFPIPMRGNEEIEERYCEIAAKFPIPMRGNEKSTEMKNKELADVPNPHEG